MLCSRAARGDVSAHRGRSAILSAQAGIYAANGANDARRSLEAFRATRMRRRYERSAARCEERGARSKSLLALQSRGTSLSANECAAPSGLGFVEGADDGRART